MRVGRGERSSTAVSGWVQRLVSQSQFSRVVTSNLPSNAAITCVFL
ncbi:hypothetical protein [Rubritalea tangerina]